MSKKVFVVSNGGHDYSQAEEFGTVVFCTDHYIRKDDISQMYREIKDSLADAMPDDYILVTSLTSMCMVATAIMTEKFGEVHLLIHSGGQYTPRDIILESQ
jgi:hypothetical protein